MMSAPVVWVMLELLEICESKQREKNNAPLAKNDVCLLQEAFKGGKLLWKARVTDVKKSYREIHGERQRAKKTWETPLPEMR